MRPCKVSVPTATAAARAGRAGDRRRGGCPARGPPAAPSAEGPNRRCSGRGAPCPARPAGSVSRPARPVVPARRTAAPRSALRVAQRVDEHAPARLSLRCSTVRWSGSRGQEVCHLASERPGGVEVRGPVQRHLHVVALRPGGLEVGDLPELRQQVGDGPGGVRTPATSSNRRGPGRTRAGRVGPTCACVPATHASSDARLSA